MSLAKLFLVGSLLVAVAWADTCTVDPKPESLTGNWVLLYWRAPESLLPQNVRCLKDWGTLVDQTVIYNTTIIIEWVVYSLSYYPNVLHNYCSIWSTRWAVRVVNSTKTFLFVLLRVAELLIHKEKSTRLFSAWCK